MGGKPKQTQRTKNNSRPSNSGRSAELFGTSMPSFVGFTSLGMCGSDVPVLPGFQNASNPDSLLDDIDAAVDTNYQLVLRKMTKKDPVTKVKALQEFLELCNASEVDAVVAILPFWPRLYAALSADVEHRVREASQQAQAGVAAKCGKHIAPFLRQLAPAWITSQFDTYAPAASLATQSFQKSFKPAKQQEVFTYCQAELLDYVTKNLTVVTAASLSTAHRTYTPEECEAKYQRLVAGSLKGYSQYLTRVSAEQLTEAADRNLAIVNHAKFWSYYKSKASSIRAAWFETLATILQHAPPFVQGHEKEATISAMQTLDETEPIVLPHVWSAVLLVTQTVPEWIQYINIDKALLPKLWKVLKTGGAGSAAVIHPHLLPLLSQLNAAALGPDKILTFYTDFFTYLHTGLLARVGHQSRSDTTAIATAYFECLRYTFIQLLKFDATVLPTEELNTFGRRLVDEHLIAVIVWTLRVDVSGVKHVYAAIGNLLGYWTQNSEVQPVYAIVLSHFWTALRTALDQSVDEDDERIEKVLRLQFELVQELRAGHHHTAKASRAKVKFIEASAVDAVDSASAAVGSGATTAAAPLRRIECNELALHLCTLYMKKASEKLSPHFVDGVENLFKAFGGAEFFERLADGNGIFKLYDRISVWLLIAQLRQENVVDILLQLYAHLNVDNGERHKLLTKLIKFPNEQVQSWVIVRLLSHPLCVEPTVPDLLAQPHVRQILFTSADRIVAGDTSTNVNFLHKCFFQNDAGDILIDATTCAGIVQRLVAALRTTSADGCRVLDTCASFLAQIMPVICCDASQSELQRQLFVAFFEFSVRQTVSEHLTQDTLWEITTSWQDALSSGDMVLSDELLGQCAAIVGLKLAEEGDAETSVENTAEMVAKLILCSVERLQADGGEDDKVGSETAVMLRIDEIIDRMFDSRSNLHRSRLSYVEHVSLFAGAVGGELSVPDIGSRLGTTDEMSSVHTIDTFMKLATFRFNVIFKITCTVKQTRPSAATAAAADVNGDCVDDDAEADEYTEDFCDASENLLKHFSDRIVDEIIGGIYVATMADTLLRRCYAWTDSTELCMLHISERVSLYLRNVSAVYAPVIRDRLMAEAKRRGQLWSASVLWLTNVAPYDDPENGLTVLREEDVMAVDAHVSKDVYVNLLQTIAAKTPPRLLPIERNLFVDDVDANLFVKCTTLRTLVENYSHGEWNGQDDRVIMEACKALMNSLYLECKRDKPYFLYNEDITNTASEHIIHIAEIANFYAAVLRAFPFRLESNDWDLIRIAVSSWTLSVSKSSDTALQSPAVAVFVVAVYRLFGAFRAFIGPSLAQRSSTHLLTSVAEEWNQLFAKDVNLILLKCYLKFVSRQHRDRLTDLLFVDLLSQQVAHIDHSHVIAARRIDSKTSLDDVLEFALTHLTNENHRVRCACAGLLRGLAEGLVAIDAERLLARQTTDDDHVDVSPAAAASRASNTWHVLHRFAGALRQHEAAMGEYSDEFSFKSNELDGLRAVPHDVALPYLLLWDCVLDVCAKAGAELRAIYAAYLTASDAPHVQRMLVSLFRLMPVELLRNQDARHIGQTYFVPLSDAQLAAADVPTRRLACNTYLRALRHLPAAVRKWWHDAPAAQKTLVDKVTTSFVSTQLCQDELRALVDKRAVLSSASGSENMQLTVHTSTREVVATYVIDEARMELIVTLPVNHPLGAVRVDSGKQIGGRMQSRVLVMQLTIFLTHQNGSISDGLSLWKRNLDRKFEGVQECYVCYAVIHQDTYQLPKLSCRKCKNKFHGPCLYKWFSTSNKSTCPICRSIF